MCWQHGALGCGEGGCSGSAFLGACLFQLVSYVTLMAAWTYGQGYEDQAVACVCQSTGNGCKAGGQSGKERCTRDAPDLVWSKGIIFFNHLWFREFPFFSWLQIYSWMVPALYVIINICIILILSPEVLEPLIEKLPRGIAMLNLK